MSRKGRSRLSMRHRVPRRISRPLMSGDAGVWQTIRAMQRLIRRDAEEPEIQQRARWLKKSNDLRSVETTFNYVVEQFSYKPDPDDEELFAAPIFLEIDYQRYGDCDDLAGILACLLLAQGFRVGLKVIAWRPELHAEGDPFTHVYAVCFLPSLNGWLPLDPVMRRKRKSGIGYDGFGGEKGAVYRKQVFMI